jgi:hypothetical protein
MLDIVHYLTILNMLGIAHCLRHACKSVNVLDLVHRLRYITYVGYVHCPYLI